MSDEIINILHRYRRGEAGLAEDAKAEIMALLRKEEFVRRRQAENDRLRTVLEEASAKLKLLYMAAGLGRKTGREALVALNDEITKIDGALEQKTDRR